MDAEHFHKSGSILRMYPEKEQCCANVWTGGPGSLIGEPSQKKYKCQPKDEFKEDQEAITLCSSAGGEDDCKTCGCVNGNRPIIYL